MRTNKGGEARKERSDRGLKRRVYNMGLRSFRKLARDLKRTLADIERFEAREEKKLIQKSRTTRRRRARLVKDRTKTTQQRRERRIAQRLADMPDDRKCPICGNVKVNRKQWVKTDNGMICKSCKMKGCSVN